jgi:hypothetical protein
LDGAYRAKLQIFTAVVGLRRRREHQQKSDAIVLIGLPTPYLLLDWW